MNIIMVSPLDHLEECRAQRILGWRVGCAWGFVLGALFASAIWVTLI